MTDEKSYSVENSRSNTRENSPRGNRYSSRYDRSPPRGRDTYYDSRHCSSRRDIDRRRNYNRNETRRSPDRGGRDRRDDHRYRQRSPYYRKYDEEDDRMRRMSRREEEESWRKEEEGRRRDEDARRRDEDGRRRESDIIFPDPPGLRILSKPPGKPTLEQELEKLDRTVSVHQIAARLTTRELSEFFERAGAVREAKIVKDSRSGISKGIAYVEFVNIDSVPKALNLQGQRILGIPCLVNRTEPEKKLLVSQHALSNVKEETDVSVRRLFVGNLTDEFSEDDLKTVFLPFGDIETVNIAMDLIKNKSKNYGFVQFESTNSALLAFESLNNFEISGKKLRVGWVSERSTNVRDSMPSEHSIKPLRSSENDRLDDDFVRVSRKDLMQRLKRDEDDFFGGEPFSDQTPSSVTRNIILQNMFLPNEETDPNWKEDIEQDVEKECSNYGDVVHCKVDPLSDGNVYVRYAKGQESASVKCKNALDGRWFGMRKCKVLFISEEQYNSKFVK